MAEELARRLDAYLEGELETSEARLLERELASSEGARALAEELLVRDLLRGLGPEAPPEGLCERIEAELHLGPERAARRPGEAGPRLVGARALLGGLGLALKGPAVGLAGAGRALDAPVSGLGTLRFLLGPLGLSRRAALPPRPLWRRLLGGRR